ncbi:MAG TPA: hypothetical protein VJR46_11405 [Candidatus Dormibacteraeota bacterium]|nr:hypothetical protein [Candidatus Dormibacteraeota bacterium]
MGARLAGAAVLLLLLASCQAMCGPVPAASVQREQPINCVDVKAPHHAYVVVQHASGAWMERCVGFAPGLIDVPTLMERAGVQYIANESAVRVVDGEPATQSDGTMRWAMFVAISNRWSITYSAFTTVQVADTQAVGWRYVRAADNAPAPPPLPHRVGG